jgi:hypothetical protein
MFIILGVMRQEPTKEAVVVASDAGPEHAAVMIEPL